MNAEPRTVTVHTSDFGPVTLPEPTWCQGAHPDGGYQADILHQGPDTELVYHGYPIGTASLVQSPYAEILGTGPGVSVSLIGQTLDPSGLDEFAAVLVEHAVALRHLARELAALLGGELR